MCLLLIVIGPAHPPLTNFGYEGGGVEINMEDDEVPNLSFSSRYPQRRRSMCQNPRVPNRFKSGSTAEELSWQAGW